LPSAAAWTPDHHLFDGHQLAAKKAPARRCSPKVTTRTACTKSYRDRSAVQASPRRPPADHGLPLGWQTAWARLPKGVASTPRKRSPTSTLCRYKRAALERLMDEAPGFAKRLLPLRRTSCVPRRTRCCCWGARRPRRKSRASF
jgi:hypothetical protein